MEKFDFISDYSLKAMLERDYKELEKCLECEANKAVLVLSGSILEAVLIDYFLNNLPLNKNKSDILKLSLSDLIDLAFNSKLISQRSKDLSTVIRTYRNLIHPGREIRDKELVDSETAKVSDCLVKMILKEIKNTNLKNYGYTAEDILKKINDDELTIVIFENLLEKLKTIEKIKLFEILINYELDEKTDEIAINMKRYINILKPFFNSEIIIEQLKKLLNEVETGTERNAIILYNLFNEDLALLSEKDIETIVLYIFSFISKYMKEGYIIHGFKTQGTFRTLGKYITTEKLLKKYEDLIYTMCSSHQKDAEEIVYYPLLEQIDINLNPSFKNRIAEIFAKRKFYTIYLNDYFGDLSKHLQ